jgi:hypothetical protein
MTGTALPLETAQLLGNVDAAVRLTPAFRFGTNDLDVAPYLRKTPGVREHRVEPVRLVLDEGMRRFPQTESASSDAWIGPRLHAALRLSRREAAIGGVWRFLGLWAADYVRWRFGPFSGSDDVDKAAKVERFVGEDNRQALARLWWMAERFRNGQDYSSAVLALRNQDLIHNMYRARLVNHRPTALAAVEVLQTNEDGKSPAGGREANALSKAANAAASTLLFDLIATDPMPDLASRETWEINRDNYDPLTFFDRLPVGPDDGEVPRESIDRMRTLLAELLAEAPVRGKK